MAAGGITWWLAWPKSDAGGITTDRYGGRLETLPRGSLPEFARSGGPEVEEVYRVVLAQGEALESVPCFCGFAKIGHRLKGAGRSPVQIREYIGQACGRYRPATPTAPRPRT